MVTEDEQSPVVAGEVLGLLQVTLLKAVLLSRPLPGADRPTHFPDLSFVLSQPPVLLVKENLMPPLENQAWPVPMRLISPETLEEEARAQGDLTYLRFQAPVSADDRALLTLEARVAPQNPQRSSLGLSGIQATFQQVGGRWEVVDEPLYFAT